MGFVTNIFKGIELPKDAQDRLAEADKIVATLQAENDNLRTTNQQLLTEKEQLQLEKETLEFKLKNLRLTLAQKESELEECKKSISKPPPGGSWMAE